MGAKKPPQSVRSIAEGASQKIRTGQRADASSTVAATLLPGALLKPSSSRWLRSVTADFALIGLNWLLMGALLVPLRSLFPQVHFLRFDEHAPLSLLGIAVLQGALITLIGQSEGLYTAPGNLRICKRLLVKSVLWATTVLCFAYGMQGAPRGTIVLIYGAGLLHFAALLAWRKHSGRQSFEDQIDSRNVLIVGAGAMGRHIASYLEDHPDLACTVYGFLDNDRGNGDRVIGRIGDLARLARLGFVDEVILAAPRDRELALQVIREAIRLRLDVKIVPELFGFTTTAGAIERIGELPVVCLHAERLPAASLALKRFVDVVGATLALIVVSPLLALIAISIKLDSHGPVFYRAPRAGRKGRLFRCYKFRTMVSNADELKEFLRQGNQRFGPFFKMVEDPRVTRLGRFLRRYSLDELPQLWNVLKGEMSLVGPRPHTADDYAEYDIEHLARLDVTPGITGLWQVTARRDPSFERGMKLDREYIRTWSLVLDARILLRTVLAVMRGSGQ